MMHSVEDRFMGYACCVEHERGWFRIISQDGRCDLLRFGSMNGGTVGSIGKLFYCTDHNSYGLLKFIPDSSVPFDWPLAKAGYEEKFPSPGWLPSWPIAPVN